MTTLQMCLFLLACFFYMLGVVYRNNGNVYGFSAISFGFTFVFVVLAVINPFSFSSSVIVVSPLFTSISNEDTIMTAHDNIPSSALSYNGHHYYIYDDVKDIEEADQMCKNLGGYLAIIDDSEENEELFEYMKRMDHEQAFFGLGYNTSTEKWIYPNGQEASYTDWGINSKGVQEPNNSGGKEFNAELDIHMNNGHWNDAGFGAVVYTPDGELYKDRYAYICEWDY